MTTERRREVLRRSQQAKRARVREVTKAITEKPPVELSLDNLRETIEAIEAYAASRGDKLDTR